MVNVEFFVYFQIYWYVSDCPLSPMKNTVLMTNPSVHSAVSSLSKLNLRTTMLDGRLSNLSVLSMHSVRANILGLEHVIDMFASKDTNCRVQLFVKY